MGSHRLLLKFMGMAVTGAMLAACSGNAGSPTTPQLPAHSINEGASQPLHSTSEHVRYRLVDVGTFGGPASYYPFLNYNSFPTINRHGAAVGASSTPVSTTPISDGFVCFGVDGLVPNVFHAFKVQGDDVTDLGAFSPSSQNCSVADSINDEGEIVGMSEIDAIDPILSIKPLRGALWKDGRMISLGTIGGPETLIFGINNRGRIVGTSVNTTPDPFSLVYNSIAGVTTGTQARAVLFNAHDLDDHIRILGTLGGPDSAGNFINDDGQVSGTSYTNSTPNSSTKLPTLDPFLWEDGKIRDVGTLGGVFGFPNGLNGRGEVIGASSDAADPAACLNGDGAHCHAFLFKHSHLIDLTTSTAGGTPLLANAINDDGHVAGVAAFTGAPFEAFFWKNGTATDIGHLNDCGSFAHAINSHDDVVGFTVACNTGHVQDAFIWHHGKIEDLNSLVPSNSKLHLVGADAINDRGVIAGMAVPKGVPPDKNGSLGHAYLLIPIEDEESQSRSPASTEGQPSTAQHALTSAELTMMRTMGFHIQTWIKRHMRY